MKLSKRPSAAMPKGGKKLCRSVLSKGISIHYEASIPINLRETNYTHIFCLPSNGGLVILIERDKQKHSVTIREPCGIGKIEIQKSEVFATLFRNSLRVLDKRRFWTWCKIIILFSLNPLPAPFFRLRHKSMHLSICD